MNTAEGRRFLELAMRIDDDRTVWILRALVLAQHLEEHGVEAEAIFQANKEMLLEMLDKLHIVEEEA